MVVGRRAGFQAWVRVYGSSPRDRLQGHDHASSGTPGRPTETSRRVSLHRRASHRRFSFGGSDDGLCDRSHSPSGPIAGTRRIKTAPRQKSSGLDPGRVVCAYAVRSLSCRKLRDARAQELEEPMMTNPKPEEPVHRPPTGVDEDWFTRIQRAKIAREQGQKAREGNQPVNPIPRMPQSPRHD